MLSAKNREESIKENIKLVHSLALKFKGRGIEYEDLFQAGCIGLIKSVDGFDESKGFAFSTYAVPVILGEIRALFRSGGPIKLSRSIKEKGTKALRMKEQFTSSFGREPTIGELSRLLGMSPEETAEVICCNLPVLSLTAGEDGEEFDIISSNGEAIDETISLKQAILKLTEEEQEIIKLRYYKELTQSKTAEILGISQVQVSRKEKRILHQLKEMLD